MRQVMLRISALLLVLMLGLAFGHDESTVVSGHDGIAGWHLLWHEAVDLSNCPAPERSVCTGCEAPGALRRHVAGGLAKQPASSGLAGRLAALVPTAYHTDASWYPAARRLPGAHLEFLRKVVIRS